jgi:D-alanine--D-alanine ligase
MGDKIKVAVVFGGQSTEHEVSRVSAQSVLENIDRSKYDVAMIGITKEGRWLRYNGSIEKIGSGEWEKIAVASLESSKCKCLEENNGALQVSSARSIIDNTEADGKPIDVVFPVLHGANGEDGTIQGLFELANIPYVGCGVLGSAVGMDKAYTKIIFEKVGIPQGKYVVVSRKSLSKDLDSVIAEVEATLIYPCFVKPSNAGSSVGVSKAHDREELISALSFAARFDRRILVEEFINGREIECAVLGNDEPIASTVGEVIPCNDFYDYEAKYQSGDDSTVVIPAELDRKTVKAIQDYAVKAFKSLDCSGLSRVDFFVHKDTSEIYINEINTMPGFTSISMYPKLWEASGIPYSELISKVIELAIERYKDNEKEI